MPAPNAERPGACSTGTAQSLPADHHEADAKIVHAAPTTVEVNALLEGALARILTDKIRAGIETTWTLIVEAYELRAWSTLGYSSWDDYCTREFRSSQIRLPRETRQATVQSLRSAGLSIRAIAAATGADTKTVQTDIAQVSEIPTRETPPTTGVDGKVYALRPSAPKAPTRKPSLRSRLDQSVQPSATPIDSDRHASFKGTRHTTSRMLVERITLSTIGYEDFRQTPFVGDIIWDEVDDQAIADALAVTEAAIRYYRDQQAWLKGARS